MKTSDWQRAVRLAERLERPNSERSDLIACAQSGCNVRVETGRCEKRRQGIVEAVEAFHSANPDLGHGTKRNYKRTSGFLELHLGKLKIHAVDETTSAAIDSLRPRVA